MTISYSKKCCMVQKIYDISKRMMISHFCELNGRKYCNYVLLMRKQNQRESIRTYSEITAIFSQSFQLKYYFGQKYLLILLQTLQIYRIFIWIYGRLLFCKFPIPLFPQPPWVLCLPSHPTGLDSGLSHLIALGSGMSMEVSKGLKCACTCGFGLQSS